MKRLIFIVLISILATSITSCNKKLKSDMDELEKSIEERKAQNSALQGEVNTLNSLLLNKPISFSFATNNGTNNVSVSGTYSFVYGSSNSSSYARDNEDGTYHIYFWRGNDLGTDYYLLMEFDYDPSTNTVTNAEAEVEGYFSDGTGYNAYFGNTLDITNTIVVSAFNYEAGTITFTYASSTTSDYGNNFYPGEGMTFSSSYSGAIAKNLGGRKK